MNDMTMATKAKSDQINADDLIGKTLTITVTGVDIKEGEQPVSVYSKEAKAFRPCKSMCRVMVAAWGADANAYIGKSMTLYRDPDVTWGGMKVGGIRISHMSDLKQNELVLAVNATNKGKRAYTVRQIDAKAIASKGKSSAKELTLEQRVEAAVRAADGADTAEKARKVERMVAPLVQALDDAGEARLKIRLMEAVNAALDRTADSGGDEGEAGEL